MEHEIGLLDERLEEYRQQRPELSKRLLRWDTIPGILIQRQRGLQPEIGDNMAQFPTAHLALGRAMPWQSRERRQAFARYNSSREPMVVPHGLSVRLGCRAHQEHLLDLAVPDA